MPLNSRSIMVFALFFLSLTAFTLAAAEPQTTRALSTRSFTNQGVGSDPFTLTRTATTITVDLTAIQGATVYRATLDPYRKPSQSRARYVIKDPGGQTLALLPPRYLVFDATAAVQAAVGSGSLVLTIENPGQGFGSTVSLDVLCDGAAPAAVTQVSHAAARFEDGDTMITFDEVNPPHTDPAWTVGAYNAAIDANGPDRSPKERYRIYRSLIPFTDPSVIAGAELIDEIMPLSGWNGRLHAFDPTFGDHDPLEIDMLPADDLTPAAPGAGIYVHRFQDVSPETAYYFVSHTLNGAEDFSVLTPGVNATAAVAESAGAGMTVLRKTEDVLGPWYWKPYVDMTLDFYVRWAAVPDWNVPNHAFNYRLGIPHNTAVPEPPLEISPHAWGGNLMGYYGWSSYNNGGVLLTANLLYYNSYTAFHECTGTLRSYADGTVQPYYHARVLDFVYNFVIDGFNIDTDRITMTGGSMGGAAGHFFGMRSGHIISFIDAAVGNNIPAEDITWEFESLGEWGPLSWQSLYSNPQLVRFGYPEVRPEDSYVVWDYFDNTQWLEANRSLATPYISYSNAPNDGAIGWEQAWKTTQSMIETRRPFNFRWGQDGHGQATDPLEIDFTLDQSVPAFSRCSLDDDLGTNPYNCESAGRLNRYLLWDTGTVVDETDRWEIDIYLMSAAPAGYCTADVTLRRLQQLLHDPGMGYLWRLEEDGSVKAQGAVWADENGLITLPILPFSKTVRRLIVERDASASLACDLHAFRSRDGGLFNFTLDAGAANAHRNYILLGGFTGTSPGYPLPGGLATLPLNWDPFTDVVFLLINTPAFHNFLGTLDAAGQSTAQANTLGPLDSSAAGVVLHFAYAMNNPWNFASSAVAVEVLP